MRESTRRSCRRRELAHRRRRRVEHFQVQRAVRRVDEVLIGREDTILQADNEHVVDVHLKRKGNEHTHSTQYILEGTKLVLSSTFNFTIMNKNL